MATKTDFTEQEWATLQRGLTGSAMLVSLSDRDFTDMFGEAGAMGKYLQGQHVAATSPLMREVADAHGTGFGLTSSPDKVRGETMGALQASIATLTAKAPDEVEPYRQLVLGVTDAVANAKGGGASDVETQMIGEIKTALGAS